MKTLQIDRLQIDRVADDNPHMISPVQKNIKEVLEKKGLSPEAASKMANLDRGYLAKLFSRPEASPRAETLQKIATALDVPISDLLRADGPYLDAHHLASHQGGESKSDVVTLTAEQHRAIAGRLGTDVRPADVPFPARMTMPNDVPVLGTAAGSHLKGAFQLTSDVIDYVRRPPALTTAKNIYALYVEGSSMEPQYFPGDLIYINPNKPPRFGDPVVVQCRNGEHGEVEATVGILAKKTAEIVAITKRNPIGDVELKREYVLEIHKVLTVNELFGV